MNNRIYKNAFNLFLKRTNEKEVIIKFIEKNVNLDKTVNFLDIGGGDGSLATIIDKKVNNILVIEPNKYFQKHLKGKGLKTINNKWENINLDKKFDFILAAYVVTYFSPQKREQLINKMYNYLNPEGKILILSIDSNKGSWRSIHTYFYKLIGLNHNSSDDKLKIIINKYPNLSKQLKTKIIAKDVDEMLNILTFDFGRYAKDFIKFKPNLKKYLEKYKNKNGEVMLEMVHNAYLISK